MDENQARWPIGELARRVAAALAVGYDGPGDARVRGVPDVRSIRWYSTIGLLDKPGGFRGRTALYGPHHLRQVVAVKRRQAAGAPLSRVQAELAGAAPAELERLARVPVELLDGPVAAAIVGTEANEPPPVGEPPPDGTAAAREGERPEGEGESATAGGSAGTSESATADATFWKTPPVNVAVTATARHADTQAANLSYGLKLAEGLTLLVDAPRRPTREDHEAVLAAAQPLLRALQARGLHITTYTGASP